MGQAHWLSGLWTGPPFKETIALSPRRRPGTWRGRPQRPPARCTPGPPGADLLNPPQAGALTRSLPSTTPDDAFTGTTRGQTLLVSGGC